MRCVTAEPREMVQWNKAVKTTTYSCNPGGLNHLSEHFYPSCNSLPVDLIYVLGVSADTRLV